MKKLKKNCLWLLLLFPVIANAQTEWIICGKVAFPSFIAPITRTIVSLFQIVVPLIIIILGSLDYMKAVTASEDKIKEHQKKFVKRLIAGGIVFFVISIVKFVTGFVNYDGSVGTCLDCLASDKSSCGAVTKSPIDPSFPDQGEVYFPIFKGPELDLDKYEEIDNSGNRGNSNSNNTSNNSSNNSSNNGTNGQYSKSIFSGDSKTVGMCGSGETTSCDSEDWQGNKLCTNASVAACGGKSYAWFRDNGVSQITSKTSGGGYNIILWWGVNDTGNSKTYSSTWASNYFSLYKTLAQGDWKNNRLVVVSVTPLRNDTSDFTNAKINSFNKDMKNSVTSSGLSNMSYCDLSSLSFSESDYTDFVHHSKSGYEKVYNYIKNNCL